MSDRGASGPDSAGDKAADQSRGPGIAGLLLVAGVAVLALVNGRPVSPVFDAALFYLSSFVPARFQDPDFLFHATTPFLAAMTFAAAGVPAALLERLRGDRRSTLASLVVWLVAAAVLSLPGILGSFGYFSVSFD